MYDPFIIFCIRVTSFISRQNILFIAMFSDTLEVLSSDWDIDSSIQQVKLCALCTLISSSCLGNGEMHILEEFCGIIKRISNKIRFNYRQA
jgi:hypothetical protein